MKITLSYNARMELINIIQSEMDVTLNPDFKARYYNLIVMMKKRMFGYDGSLETLEVSSYTGHFIQFTMRLKSLYLKNLKYNNTISSELREYLPFKIYCLTKKVGNVKSNYKSYIKEKYLTKSNNH